MPAPSDARAAKALLLNSDGIATARAVRFVELLGIESATLAADDLVDRCTNQTGPDVRIADCLVLSGQDAILLADSVRRRGVPPAGITAPFRAVVLHSIDPNSNEPPAVAALLGEVNLAFGGFATGDLRYRVSSDHRTELGPLSGLSFGPIDHVGDRGLDVVAPAGTVERLIAVGGQGLLTRIRRPSQQVLIAATTEIMDLDQTVSKNIDFRTCFSRVAPLLIALRSIFRDASWAPHGTFANIIIDDPPLWPRYGHLDLQRLAETVNRLGCACTIGMIPWNYRRSRRKMVEIFARSAPRLGICYHGCDHSGAEFGNPDGAALRGLLVTARQRMRHHEQRTGLRCQPVMVFPQGIFSVEAVEALKATGYLAAANTEVQDHQQRTRLTVSELLRPAITCYGGFPLFARRNPSDGPVNFAMDMFLGRPCLIVLHHGFFKHGLPAFEGLVRTISGLDQNLTWDNLENIVTACSLRKAGGAGGPTAMIFANEACLQFDQAGPSVMTVIKSLADDDRPLRVEVNGEAREYAMIGRFLVLGLPATDRPSVQVKIFPKEQPLFPPARQTLGKRLQVAARRYASEFRDRHLSRF